MTTQEKIKLLEDMMELDQGTLKENTKLLEIAEWDSMAALSLIALFNEDFNKKLTGNQIREFKTIQNILDCMQ